MIWILFFLLILIAVVAVGLAKAKAPSRAALLYPYVKKQAVFTPAERSFLGVLDQVVGSDYRVLGKVRVADLVEVRPLSNASVRQAAFNRIKAKHFDFVLCDKNDLSLVAVLELDDKSHSAKKRRERDAFLENVCEAVSLSLVRLPARRAYTRSDVERLVSSRLEKQVPTETLAAEPEIPPQGASIEAPVSAQEQTATPPCPKCSSPMVLRRVKRGARAGEKMWGCKSYPTCRGIVPFNGLEAASSEDSTAA